MFAKVEGFPSKKGGLINGRGFNRYREKKKGDASVIFEGLEW